ncbi:ubiquitin carboxyl-terminal hydrolase 31 isoform X1 [Crotalus tigris]|uniref:ubiquitin carboxyl-terminal hydrolase 31 isoform X1 n=1 Tax=Crotalus tigris TaxID=88082 RepID=UPI00192F75DE|nr:ubiquitin carboxyl-terminal hydrolase 31 isoform X1 [Crotalus tigris]
MAGRVSGAPAPGLPASGAAGPGSPAAGKEKEKRSLGKRLFFRGRGAGGSSLGGLVSRVLRTLSTLSHLGGEHGPPAAAAAPPPPEQPPPPREEERPEPPPPAPPGAPCCPPGGAALVPGVAGLRNHGNTCFMNAVLQCLSNTEPLAEFLALEHFRGPPAAPPPPPEPRAAGEVTEQLAQLVRALWTLQYTPQHSREFKSIVSKNALQFRGSSQHDAQEFLLWLLDRVHEDLHNLVKNSDGRASVKLPLEEDSLIEGSLLPVNSTFVQELFQAQYRSSLTCPHCQKQSNTFDPFLCISLPIPLPHTRPLYITVVYRGKCSHCMRIGVAVPLSGTVAQLREAVARETKIPAKQIVLTEMYYDGFHRSFSDLDDLDTVQESDCIFAFETPEIFWPEGILSQRGIHTNANLNHLKYSLDHAKSPTYAQATLESGSARTTAGAAALSDKLVVLVCNRACSGQQGKRFGQPFVLHLEKTIPWDLLQKEILEKMQYFLRPSACIQVCPFSLRVVSAVGITYLLPQEERPLCHLMVERTLKSCGTGGTPHVKLVVEWDKETKDYLVINTEDEYIPDAESVRQQRALHQQPLSCTLAQCFQLYTKEEQLAPDDAWRCPHCKQLQQGSISLSLWTLPDVLIIHLKRFRQEGDRRMKLQNMVRFPLTGLDMTPHVVKRSQSSWSLPSHWSPWRRPYGLGRDPEDFIYDLYAVCNHHGTMQGGHYTAYCKNSVDGLWYCFDDSEVQQLAENEVCKPTAYILFYQRRTAIPAWSANSSVAGSTSSSLCEHWVSRLPGSKPPSVASAASSRRTSLASLSESVELMGERSEDDGGFSTRPFVRSVQRQNLSSRSSVTSPLATNENGVRPSWSLSAKLQMRSNSASPVHGSSATLERIGESADDRVATSCFGSRRSLSGSPLEPREAGGSHHSQQDSRTLGRAPLAVMEGIFRDDAPAWKAPGKTGLQTNRNRSPLGPFDNNNQIAFVDQSDSVESSPVKDSQNFGWLAKPDGGSPLQAPPSQDGHGQGSGLKSGRAVLSSQDSLTSHRSVASPPPSKALPKAPRSRSKLDSCRASGRPGSPAARPGKKDAGMKGPEAASATSTQQKHRPVSLPSSSAAARRSSGGSVRGHPPSGKSRTSERGLSREGSKLSMGLEKTGGAASPRTNSPRLGQARGEGRAPEGKHVRSTSLASLRSPSTGSRSSLKRDSKSEEKGLSFFKSALRQKETRRSADLGKTTLLAKKTGGGSCKAAGKTLSEEKPLEKATLPNANVAAKDPLLPGKRSLLTTCKLQSSQPEGSPKSPGGGRPAINKAVPRLPPAVPSSTRAPSLSP